MADLHLICDTCRKPIDGATGYLWVDNSQINAVVKAVAEWNRAHTIPEGEPLAGGRMCSATDLFSYPEAVQWQAHHHACDPSQDASAYSIQADRISTWRELLDWTAHLMEKEWLTHTDWDDVLRGIHGGQSRLVLAATN
ncbi:hypothetical protein BJ965_001041 [Streptomyces luteogriseus]|uniref:Uncharacterized protein n=1 Tax=Streptomyces luteogriseus TaxID=68233 RepID=A0A7W7DHY5_9ACTN|nr:hypothetical protein [Streptomyces luteogriseus]MBB4711159.1 hypothetical protein [Streptomyces luteogriseus]